MKIIEQYLPDDHPNRPGRKLEALKAIVIHYTQNDHPRMTDTKNVRWISREYIRNENGLFEVDGKTRFRYGSAHVFCDIDSATIAIPPDEAAWACGDKHYHGGQQKIAKTVFSNRQNFQSISVEICNNDVIENSDEDWCLAVLNAKQWVIDFLKFKELRINLEGSLNPQALEYAPEAGDILILRHYDITGKICPKPFVNNHNDWHSFVTDIAKKTT